MIRSRFTSARASANIEVAMNSGATSLPLRIIRERLTATFWFRGLENGSCSDVWSIATTRSCTSCHSSLERASKSCRLRPGLA